MVSPSPGEPARNCGTAASGWPQALGEAARTGPGRFDLLLMETPPAAGDERWRAIGAGAALGPHLPAGRVVQYRGDYRWADATLPGTGSARAAENVLALLAAYAGIPRVEGCAVQNGLRYRIDAELGRVGNAHGHETTRAQAGRKRAIFTIPVTPAESTSHVAGQACPSMAEIFQEKRHTGKRPSASCRAG